jgi:hypothetical protein
MRSILIFIYTKVDEYYQHCEYMYWGSEGMRTDGNCLASAHLVRESKTSRHEFRGNNM